MVVPERLVGVDVHVAIETGDERAGLHFRNHVACPTDGRGADYVFVTVGAKQAFDSSYGLLAKSGTVVLVGMPANGVMSEIDPGTMAAYSQNILGSKMGSARIQVDIPNLISLYEQGRLKLDELVTKTYPLEEINEAIAAVKRGDALRNVIVF
jgi:Zn-dependent alcohol dehydrogenase